MDSDLQVIEALKEVARQKVVAEAEEAGVAPALSNRKTWLRFKRENANAWAQGMIEKLGLNFPSQSHSQPANPFRNHLS